MGSPEGFEIELKLHVPDASAAAVEKALHDPIRSTRTHLRAAYYDTPDGRLAEEGLAWRVRREGTRWVQTIKGSPESSDEMAREEHNVALHARAWPEPDASLHAGVPVGDRLIATLNGHGGDGSLAEQFRTDIWRLERPLRVPEGQVVLAYDKGTIHSGDESTDVCELEVELVSGSPLAIIHTGRRWAERYDLWLDTVNKAQRGAILASGHGTAPVTKGMSPTLTPDMAFDGAVRQMVHVCLIQMVRNLAAVANGMASEEHIHQARVGIRRMRTVLHQFGPMTPAVDPDWDEQLAAVFRKLGATRDYDIVKAMTPALVAAGGPLPPLPAQSPADAIACATDPAVTLLVFDLLDYVHGDPVPTEHDGNLVGVVADALTRLRRHTLREHDKFPSLTEEEQHTVRKRLKRLRYTAELTAELFPQKKVKRFLRTMSPAQDALGALTDLFVARDIFTGLTAQVPEAWFAVGWTVAQQPETAEACIKPLRKVADAPRYWRSVGGHKGDS